MHRRLVLFVLALAIALVGCGRDDATVSSDGTATTEASATGALIFFNPTRLPDGIAVEDVTLRRGQESPAWAAKVGRPDGPGKFRDVMSALVFPPDSEDSVEGDGSSPVDINGQRAREVDNEVIGTSVSWRQNGHAIVVLGKAGQGAEVRDLARRLRVGPTGAPDQTRIEGAPAGMEVISASSLANYPQLEYTINAQTQDEDAELQLVRIQVMVVPAETPPSTFPVGDEFDLTRKVRGHGAVVGRTTTKIAGNSFTQVTLA